ncbi:MAG: putative metallopeptidase [Candidatus Micrarchaeota archaeon]
MEVEKAPDVQAMVDDIVTTLNTDYLNQHRLICMRSHDSSANAYARIWNLPKIWQTALDVGTFYVIEVLAEHFDRLPQDKKEQVLVHELLHIPKTFSGALLAHGHPSAPVNDRTALRLWKEYKQKKEKLARDFAYQND